MFGMGDCLCGAILTVLLSCSVLCVGVQITNSIEVFALNAIKSELRPQNHLNWTKGDPCTSNWIGVSCFDAPLEDGYLHVRELQLLKMNLSGNLSSNLGLLSRMKVLDFMWNQIGGSIPKEIGKIKSLELLLLSGNQLSGPLPEELGYLPNLNRFQIDENHISGTLPKAFENLEKAKHFHMNNNSISGQIPSELSRLPNLVHLLLDNNNLSGNLPPEFSQLPQLTILQLDNNHLDTEIPASYGNMSRLVKLSLRNCSLRGAVPDLSRIPQLTFLDLSHNQLTGPIPTNKLSTNITTIDLSDNSLNGSIPANFSGLPFLQKMFLQNNLLSGSVPLSTWENIDFGANTILTLDFQNNSLSNIVDILNPPPNVTIRLQGNPVCTNANQNLVQFCSSQDERNDTPENSTKSRIDCPVAACAFEYVQQSPGSCFCAAPLRVGYRLKSPGLSYFLPYKEFFKAELTSATGLELYQLSIDSFIWEEGPRLMMYLKLFPLFSNQSGISHLFNQSEIRRLRGLFTSWGIHNRDIFGPYELLNFTLLWPYLDELPRRNTGLGIGAVAGVVLGAVAGAVTISVVITVLFMRKYTRKNSMMSRRHLLSKFPIKIDGVKEFTFGEMAQATNNFSHSTQVGQGGYGKVYRGMLADHTVIAVKRAQKGSLQGQREFLTEIELLSRLHHRNLVSLLGYCIEEEEQMLVYEFMPNGTLQDHLCAKSKVALSFTMRLHIALGSAKGILYLHTEADPPIFHRDIKASNILLDSKFTAKVADFGLSRLAPVPVDEGALPGHVSTVVKGTPGYLDPEYFMTHKLTDKSDVYSLGVVFLELLTGMQPIWHGKNIVREVNMASQSGMMFAIIDKKMGSYPSDCVKQFVSLALGCCQDHPDERPSVSEIVRELESIWRMTPEAETTTLESMTTASEIAAFQPSSSKITGSYVSSEVSGSDLLSDVLPDINPR